MFGLGSSIVVIGTLVSVVWTQIYPAPFGVDCDDGYCLVLFRAYININWQGAYDDCSGSELQLQMLPILTPAVQHRVRLLLESVIDKAGSRLVWVAGRQKDDDVWRYVDGTADNSGVHMIPGDSGQHCVYIGCTDANLEFNTDNCATENGHHQIICQKSAEHYSSAGPYNILSGDYSYRLVDTTDDWFSARTLCVQDGGDLIHSNILDSSLRRTICDRITFFSGTKRYWVGLTKYPWTWIVPGQEPKPITYFSWTRRSDRQDNTDDCITLRSSSEYQWVPHDCHTDYTPYFLCANGTIPSMTTTPTTPATAATNPAGTPSSASTPSSATSPDSPASTPSPAASTPTQTSSLVSTTSKETAPPSSGFELYYIAIIGVVAILIIVIPVVIVVYRRKKKDSQKQAQASNRQPGAATGYVDGSFPSDADLADPGYATVNSDFPNTSNDAIAPYGEYRQEAPPSADTGSAAVYANVNKKRNSRFSVFAKLKPAITSKKPKLKNKDKTVMIDEVPHVMTTEGDMYAVSLNDKRLLEESRQSPVEHITTDTGDVYALPMK